MFGGDLPWTMVDRSAAVIGIVIIMIDEILRIVARSFRVPVLAAAVGIYLPLDVTMPIFLGGLLAWFAERDSGRAPCRPRPSQRRGHRAAGPQGHVVRRRHDHRRGADGHTDRHAHRGLRPC